MILAAEQLAATAPTPALRAPKPPRCGCCDQITHFVVCEQCQEPTCERHLERVQDVTTNGMSYVCTLCAHERIEAGLARALPGTTGVLQTLHALDAGTTGGRECRQS